MFFNHTQVVGSVKSRGVARIAKQEAASLLAASCWIIWLLR